MYNLFDMMRQAQGGAGLDNMARQFGIAPAQSQAAVAALLPALVMGLQRAAMNPAAMGELMSLANRAPFAAFFQSAAPGFSPQARRDGDEVLLRLFGSAEMGRAVAQQAAAFSGLAAALLWQMLPIVAAMFMGGLLVALQQGMLARPAPSTPPSGSAPGAGTAGPASLWPWADFMTGMLAPTSSSGTSRTPDPARTPLEDMMNLFLAGFRPPTPEPPPSPAPPSPVEAWNAWMNAGRDMQTQYFAALRSLFDASSGGR